MDVRVFPFAFPPIRGGAQGGDSPTPTPPPITYPYDFSEAALHPAFRTDEGNWITATWATSAVSMYVDGIVSLDTSNVASLVIVSGFTSITADGVEVKDNPAFTRVILSNALTGADVAISETAEFYRARMEPDDWNDIMAGKAAGGEVFFTITAYDSNGNALQTKTWSALVS